MKTATAEVTLDHRGVTIVRVNQNARQTLEDAKENLAAAITMGAGAKRPLLTDIRLCEPLTPEARRYYSGKILSDKFTAIAIVIAGDPFGRMMGNIYLKIANPGIPAQLFTDESEAITWLMKQ